VGAAVMLALFGFFMAWAYSVPWWVWVIGFLCLIADGGGRKK
jgi:hypothetical protein